MSVSHIVVANPGKMSSYIDQNICDSIYNISNLIAFGIINVRRFYDSAHACSL